MNSVGAFAAIDRDALEQMLGLDVPIYVQYGRWIGGILLEGTLGTSLWGDWTVEEKILGRLPVTVELGAMAILIGLLIALPVGIYSAIRQDTAADYVGRSVAIIGLATPNFWLGIMVMIYPALWWGWAPSMRLIPFTADPLGNLGMFLIPSLILGTAMAAATMRMTRTMMLEVLRQDYIRTAWSKGLKERLVVVRHAVKHALIPVVTLVGMQLPILLGGAVIMENIFNLPGLGNLLLLSHQRPGLPGGVRNKPAGHRGRGVQSAHRSHLSLFGPPGHVPATTVTVRSPGGVPVWFISLPGCGARSPWARSAESLYCY